MTRERLYGFIAIVVVAVALSAFLVTRNTRDEVLADSAPAPGFDGEDRAVDDSPFELAEPTTTAGPTTLPIAPSTRRTTTTTTTTTTPPTTTTTLPTNVIVATNVDTICGLSDSVQSLQLVFTDPSLDAESIMTRILDNLVRYVTVSPPELRDDVVGIRTEVSQLTDILRAAGWDARRPEPQQAVIAIQRQQPPFGELTNRVGKILFYESATCPR